MKIEFKLWFEFIRIMDLIEISNYLRGLGALAVAGVVQVVYGDNVKLPESSSDKTSFMLVPLVKNNATGLTVHITF